MTPEDRKHLDAARGWLALGKNFNEAAEELGNVSAGLENHPEVLGVQWEMHFGAEEWASAVKVAETLTRVAPKYSENWLRLARSLDKSRGPEAAWEKLLPASLRFQRTPEICYELATLAARLGNLEESWAWLEKSFEQADDATVYKSKASEDPLFKDFWR